ncbi:OmpA family protein [Minwuia sp.]|uniref:OmpA family protein n=1 Tax=Minwuia sp. TaxID=2493630 RepID=UPI003A91B24E
MMRFISAFAVALLLATGAAYAQQDTKAKPAGAETTDAVPAEGASAETLSCECDTEVNALFVTILDNIRKAEAVGVLPLERYRFYRLALRGIDQLVDRYPRSWIAVRILADQPIGNFYYGSLKRRFRLAAVEACGAEKNAPEDCRTVLSEHLQTIVVELRTVETRVVQVQELITRLEASFNGQVDRIAALSTEVGSLRAQLASGEQEKADLNATIAEIQALADRFQRNLRNAATKRREAEVERDQLQALLESEKQRGEDLSTQLVAAKAALEGKSGGVDRAEMGRLQGQLLAATNRINRLEGQLAKANERAAALSEREDVKIIDYRTDFLARINELGGVAGENEIQGERIVFSSEVLFDVGKATLRAAGKKRLDAFAAAVKQAAPEIPADVNWALQIDGHTDIRPISTAQFPSNWELSIARAISVVHYLNSKGIPYERLVAAAHAEFHPRDRGTTEAAYQKNRRVEVRFLEQ